MGVLMGVAAVLLAMVPLNNPIMHTVGFTLVYFAFGLLLALSIDLKPQRYLSVLLVAPLARIGYYSYSIYLWHGWVCRLLPHVTFVGMLRGLAISIVLGAVMPS
ncbi:MAG: hypothetical protein ACJ71S_07750 [Acidobacteriaceae bacterium]